MKRSTLLSLLIAFAVSVTVGYSNSTDNKEAGAYAMDQSKDIGQPVILQFDYSNVGVETGEFVLTESPMVIYTDVVSPVDVKPPINANEKLLRNRTAHQHRNLLPDIRRLSIGGVIL